MTGVCTLASSSSGNCILVSHQGQHIMVDMGISLKKATTALAQLGLTMGDISALLVTHSHGDHISGLNTLCKRFQTPIFATADTAAAIAEACPAAQGKITVFAAGDSFTAGNFQVSSFATPHDCPGSVCYRIALPTGDLGIMTDLGYVPPKVLEGMEGVAALVLESNHDIQLLTYGPYPYPLKQRILSDHGHLSNDSACEAAVWYAERGTKCFILAHLSKDNNNPALARQAMAQALEPYEDVRLFVAPPEMGQMIEIG